MSPLRRLSKLNHVVSLVALVIAPVFILFLSQRLTQTTTPDRSQAASVSLTTPRVIRVMEISYLMSPTDTSMVSAVSSSLKQSIVEASKPKGTGTSAISGVSTIHTINRTGPRPAGSSWQAGLQNIISQDNLCQRIVDDKIDQVWIWVDPNRDTVNGFNQEYAISSPWVQSSIDSGTVLCGGGRSFVVLGLQYTVGSEFAMHSLGHAMEALLAQVQGSNLFWTRWTGSSGSTSSASMCGNVHFPPNGNAGPSGIGYDYENQTARSTKCPNWNPDGTGTAINVSCTSWGCTHLGYMKWWFQQMPHSSQNHTYSGKRVPTWVDFMVDFENAITYYVQNNYWVDPYFYQFVTPASVEKVSGTTQQAQSTSLSFAHTTTGNNRMVLLTASYRAVNQSADDKITSANYAGVPFTFVRRNQKGEYTTEIWYAKGALANSGNVVVNFGGNVQDKSISATSFSDVDQTNPLHVMTGAENGSAVGSGGTGNRTISVSVPSETDQIVVGVLSIYTGNGNQATPVDPAQVLYSRDTSNVLGRASVRPSSGSSTTLSWQITADWPWSISAVSVRKSTGTPPPTTPPPTPPPPSPTPGTPTLSSPTNGAVLTDYTPAFSWSQATGAATYRIQVSDNSSFSTTAINTTVSTLSYTPTTNLPDGKTYYWRVQAINSSGISGSWSSVGTFTLTTNTAVTLQSPSNGSTVDTLKPTFDWSEVATATSYKFQLSDSSSFGTFLVNTSVTSSSYVQTTNLSKNTTYYWRVRPVFGTVNGTMSSVSSFVSANPPNVPTLSLPATGGILTASTSGTNNVLRPRLSWTTTDSASAADPVSYDIQIAKNSAFTNVVIEKSTAGSDLGGSTATSLKRYWDVDQNLENATTYYWRVRSSSSAGHKSNWSASFSFKVPIATPTALNSPANNSTANSLRPVFDWGDVTGAASYSVYIKYGTGTETLLATTAAATATVPSPSTFTPTADLQRSKQVTWRVRANSTSFGNASSGTAVFNTPNPPNTPTLLKPNTASTAIALTPTLRWSTAYSTTIPQPDSYDIELSTSSTFATIALQRSVTGTPFAITSTLDTRTWVVDTNLAPKTTYYWRVRAKKSGQIGNWSSKFNFKTL